LIRIVSNPQAPTVASRDTIIKPQIRLLEIDNFVATTLSGQQHCEATVFCGGNCRDWIHYDPEA
jgi:hypothetical protein